MDLPDAKPKRKFKRLHKTTCGVARNEYDSYADVREACERKLRQWEREGVLAPSGGLKGHDWIFGSR